MPPPPNAAQTQRILPDPASRTMRAPATRWRRPPSSALGRRASCADSGSPEWNRARHRDDDARQQRGDRHRDRPHSVIDALATMRLTSSIALAARAPASSRATDAFRRRRRPAVRTAVETSLRGRSCAWRPASDGAAPATNAARGRTHAPSASPARGPNNRHRRARASTRHSAVSRADDGQQIDQIRARDQTARRVRAPQRQRPAARDRRQQA